MLEDLINDRQPARPTVKPLKRGMRVKPHGEISIQAGRQTLLVKAEKGESKCQRPEDK